MTGRVALIAGGGALPAHLAGALDRAGADWIAAAISGVDSRIGGRAALTLRIERLVPFFTELRAAGVGAVVFAGAVRRPQIDPSGFDPETLALLPRIAGAIGQGDDAALRAVIGLFEEAGFAVLGAESVAPDLVPGPGILSGQPCEADRADAARAAGLIAALGPLDLGQGAVVAQGLCLALETLPGTDAMLDFVARHAGGLRPDPKGGRGVLYKAPKPGQDRRADLPAIGPETVRRAAAAGLAGIAWEAGGVMLLDREAALAEAGAAGLFLWAREP